MAKSSADLMYDNSEIVHYDTAGIPLYIRHGRITDYPTRQALCHWHEDLEFIRILDGKMNYRINGKKILLEKDDCLMVNSRQMHYGYAYCGQECVFTCTLFHPKLFTGSQLLVQRDVQPILDASGPAFLLLHPGMPLHGEMLETLDTLTALRDQLPVGYELEAIGRMHILWSRLLRESLLQPEGQPHSDDPELSIQRDMVAFVYEAYADRITLDDIAAAGKVSRSKCCDVFRRYLQQSPIDFLNHYRLEVSRNLLQDTGLSVTQIATTCGFNHPSYFSKLFVRDYGCTPNAYRKQHRRN